ncbi:MAG: S8 family serine peptidase [Fusicatenibacter saccharivorans]
MKEQENLTGKGITAAVLDTGIFPHIDFDNRIVAFRDLVYGRETPYDDNGHGTHVCGILWRKWKSVRRKIPGCGTGMPGLS